MDGGRLFQIASWENDPTMGEAFWNKDGAAIEAVSTSDATELTSNSQFRLCGERVGATVEDGTSGGVPLPDWDEKGVFNCPNAILR